jgi:excisionase family DNA binding protein
MGSSVSRLTAGRLLGRQHRELLTTEAAEILGVTSATIRRWVSAGVLPARRVGPGGRIRIDPADLERLFSKTTVR